MRINELFRQKKVIYSFEIFPPKTTAGIDTVYKTLDAINGFRLKPDYISITYGAGGTAARDNATIELASAVKDRYGIEPLAHLTGIHSTKESVKDFALGLSEHGIENILALRGDRRPELELSKDFHYASDLVKYLNTIGSFNIAGACYPEGHFESESQNADIEHLKYKVDCGITHLNSQLFFDNDDFYRFMEKVRKAGITVPVEAGIMPITNPRQIQRTLSLSGVQLPAKFSRLLARYSDNEEALFSAGIAYSTQQIIDLLTNGVDGIHLYIMNNAVVAKTITDNVAPVLSGINSEAK